MSDKGRSPTSMDRLCPQCGKDRVPNARFCAHCGVSFETPPPPPPAPQPPASSEVAPTTRDKASSLPSWIKPAGIVVGIFILLSVIASNNDPSTDSPVDSDFSGIGDDAACTRQVVYEVEGTAPGADITMTDSSGSISQQSGLAVPLQSTSGEPGIRLPIPCGDFASISAQNTGGRGTITCRITADGVVLDETSSSGAYVIASCDATIE